MAVGDKVKIEAKGKEIEGTVIQEGVVRKTDTILYIRDSVSGVWSYCSPDRLKRLNEKFNGDLSGYKDRATRNAEKVAAKAGKNKEVDTQPAETAAE